ncbi:MAG: aspartate/glutamate racemase family protein [Pseudomonadota bacterium]
MRILVVNPNTTESMTAKIGEAARAVAAPGTEITALDPGHGPVSVEGHYDGVFCLPGLLQCIRQGEAEGYDGFVVACFDDPGIGACREIATGPVIGICEAAMHAASLIANSFSVVTTLPRAIPVIEELGYRYGMERRLRRVRAAAIPVLALEDENSEAATKVRAEVERAVEEDGAEAILLGCAGMADLAAWLTERTGVPVIDGVGAAVKLAEAMIGLGLRTSKVLGYAHPHPKPYAGDLAHHALPGSQGS